MTRESRTLKIIIWKFAGLTHHKSAYGNNYVLESEVYLIISIGMYISLNGKYQYRECLNQQNKQPTYANASQLLFQSDSVEHA